MFQRVLLISFLYSADLYSQTDDQIADLKNGGVRSDSTYVYSLPYQKGKSFLLVQGYNSKLSHRGEIALDFKMRRGTDVCAMRDGIVHEIREDSNRGGLRSKYISEGNYILIKHNDGSFAWYFHLRQNGALVEPGSVVRAGQIIGRSGNSGYSAFPHLHVEIVVQGTGRAQQIPARFQTRSGIHYLKPGRFYRNPRQ
jgi:murein DD-endopeptidase MepM/ murein hydrolase activator NlpD